MVTALAGSKGWAADTVSVLQGGHVVESGAVEDVFGAPRTAYARDLIDAVPGRRLLAAE